MNRGIPCRLSFKEHLSVQKNLAGTPEGISAIEADLCISHISRKNTSEGNTKRLA